MTGARDVLILAALTLPLAWAGCGGEASSGSEGGRDAWRLAETPSVRVGVREGDPRHQLHDVTDAARLPDGRLAVADQGSREVRIYGADGAFLGASGGPGDGPGEWRQIAAVHVLASDTLVMLDPRIGRAGLVHATSAAYLGELDDGRAADVLPVRRHESGLVLEAPGGFTRWDLLDRVVDAVDVRSTLAPARIRLDAEGRAWVLGAPSADVAAVRVFDLHGTERAMLTLPDRFQPLRMGPREIVGVVRDSFDVEYVEVRAMQGAEAPWTGPSVVEVLSGSPPPATPAGADGTEAPELVGHFRDLAIAQEMHYAQAGSYTTNVAALSQARALELPATLRVDMYAAGPTGWWGRLVDTETGAGCTLVYGSFLPVEGLAPGAPACWPGAESAP